MAQTSFPQTRSVSRRGMLAGATAVAGLMTVQQGRAQGIAPKKGGTLNTILTPEPPILILGINGQGPTLICATKIYQGLLKFSPKLEPLPELAKSWSLSDDKKTYTFKLQDNVKFHDGQPMTADDVVFSVMKFHMEVSPRARSIFAMIKAASAPDPHTATFTLEAPFDPFLLMFEVTACAIMPKHIYDGTDYRNNPHNTTPIGTGPFKFAEWQRGNFIRLARFDDYWKPGQPYLDEIIFRIVPDSQSRALALQTGQVQQTAENDIEPFDVPRFKAQPNLTVDTGGWEYFAPVSWIEVNNRVKPLDDRRVRQAISMAIDRNFILNRLWFGVGRVATSPIASTTRFHDPASKLAAHDPKGAMALLDEAGLKPGANGVRFSIKHLVLPYGEVWTRLAEYFRTSLQQVGIELVLEIDGCRGVGAAHCRLGLRYVGQLRLSVRRSDLGRRADLCVEQHQEGHVHQHRRLQQSAGGCLVREGARVGRPEGTSGSLLRSAEDSDRGHAADLDDRARVPDDLR